MKKNTKRARLQSLDNAQLAQVTGGSLAGTRDNFAEGSAYYVFFDAAWTASGGCSTTTCGYSSTPIP
jgi:hypothetical protein